MSATPRPWSILQEGRTWRILDANGDWVLVLHDLLELPDALRVMVRCVNSHDRLVEALRTLVNNPIVSGMSARIRGEANERAVPDAYAAAEAALKEAGAE